MEKRPIMIIAAMEDAELNILKKEAKNIKEVGGNTCKFYETEIYGYPLVLCASDIGCISAASAMTQGVLKYNPIAIINQGLAGAITKDIHRSDVVVGTEMININSIRTPKKKEGEGSNSLEWELVTFIRGEEDRLVVEKADDSLVNCVKKIEHKYTKGKVNYGRIGSGDVWNSEIDRLKMLNEKYDVLCEEMEGIAVYKIANLYKVPVINIRAISDNELLGEEYDRSLGEDLQYFVMEFIKEYIKKID